jgi:hypothetical protein
MHIARMDAAGAVDAEDAPTASWKTAQNAVSHSAHTHQHSTRSTHEIPGTSLTTASNGNAVVDFEFRALMILAGTTNDVMFRLVDDDTVPTTELRSDCMVITAR